MKIQRMRVLVNDQDKARSFYTEKLGLVIKDDHVREDGLGWVTVVSPEDPEGTELVLVTTRDPGLAQWQKVLFDALVPAVSLSVDNFPDAHDLLEARGAVFRTVSANWGGYVMVFVDDGCGNLVEVYHEFEEEPDPGW